MLTANIEKRAYDIHYDYTGLAADRLAMTIPSNASGDSTFYEIDTKKAYMLDKEHNQWVEM